MAYFFQTRQKKKVDAIPVARKNRGYAKTVATTVCEIVIFQLSMVVDSNEQCSNDSSMINMIRAVRKS